MDYLELPQSGNQGALLDLENASNIGVPGTYVFNVRGGSTAPAISVGDASVVEGNGPNNRFLVVPVFLAAASGSEITVQYSTANGSAVSGQDYRCPERYPDLRSRRDPAELVHRGDRR